MLPEPLDIVVINEKLEIGLAAKGYGRTWSERYVDDLGVDAENMELIEICIGVFEQLF